MKKIKWFLFILGWQVVGFVVTVIITLPTHDFHHFVHEVMICLTFTNLVGLAGLLSYGLYNKVFKPSQIPNLVGLSVSILVFLLTSAVAFRFSMQFGGFICGLDQYHVERWHLAVLVVDFVMLVVIAIVAILFSLYEKLATRLELKIRENERLHRLQIESKLSLLQSKINPHFLFNTLNTMLDVLRKSPKQVEKIILNLSDIYRKTLMMPDNSLVPLKDEITLVEEYLEIEQIRMGARLKYDIQMEESLQNVELPPMMLQILVENAVKHGLSPKKEGGTVLVQIKREDNQLILEVADSGVGIGNAQSRGSGFGLASIEQRLKLMYENAKLSIQKVASGGTQVRISLPYAT